MSLNYDTTMHTCFRAYVVQTIVNSYAPLLFVIFQDQFDIPLSWITLFHCPMVEPREQSSHGLTIKQLFCNSSFWLLMVVMVFRRCESTVHQSMGFGIC